jgi:hypothetical protein
MADRKIKHPPRHTCGSLVETVVRNDDQGSPQIWWYCSACDRLFSQAELQPVEDDQSKANALP